MGASVSKNATKVIINAVAKVTSDLVQKTSISTDTSQMIYITDTGGDVIIKGNVMTQKAVLNMTAVFDALNSVEVQENIATEIAQSAKSLISGINLAQFSDATNDIEELINTCIEIVTNIEQTCSETMAESQTIIITHTRGSVRIENNLFEQVSSIFQSCIESATSNSNSFQSITAKLDQYSSSTAAGISEWALVGLLAVFIGIPTIGGVAMGKSVLKYLFPLMIVAGIIMIVLYYVLTKREISVKGYSSSIESTPLCYGEELPTAEQSFKNIEDAAKWCIDNNQCVAFDWRIDSRDKTPMPTKFYKSVSEECQTLIREDNSVLLRKPELYTNQQSASPVPPIPIPASYKSGDVWINLNTSEIFQLKPSGEWYAIDKPITDPIFKIISIGAVLPTQPGINEYSVVFDPTPSILMTFYQYTGQVGNNKWKLIKRVKGLGYVAANTEQPNASGFIIETRKTWLLYGAVTAIVLGITGTFIVSKYVNNRGDSSSRQYE